MSRRILTVACLAFGTSWLALGSGVASAKDPAPTKDAQVQIAILLDTSSSMDGLIGQAKTQLWKIVNEFVRAKRDGKAPTMQVALFEYGKPTLGAETGYVRMILPLTDDLDKVSEELFSLKTNGGDEFCGKVIQEAVSKLSWGRSRDVYKGIFIAGNEPFTQGPVDYRSACRGAIGQGIIVNTIHCGPSGVGESTGWKDGAILADGRFMNIDQNQKIADIPTPQDKEIARLGVDLNRTYIPYGTMGKAGQMRQEAQDANAASAGAGVIAARSVSKGGQVYRNDAWDLVDGIKNGKTKLEDLDDKDLPEDFRKLNKAERKAKVEEMGKQREELQKKILRLNEERSKYIAAESLKKADPGKDTLDSAIIKAIREQAARLHFTFE